MYDIFGDGKRPKTNIGVQTADVEEANDIDRRIYGKENRETDYDKSNKRIRYRSFRSYGLTLDDVKQELKEMRKMIQHISGGESTPNKLCGFMF